MSHHQGLQADLQQVLARQMSRRRLIALGLGSAAVLVGCGTEDSTTTTTTTSSTTDTSGTTTTDTTTGSTTTTSCSVIPEETGGPYPADGSNGQNVLTRSGVVRSDIRSSLSTGTVAVGVPLTVKLKLVNTNNACAALSGYAIYLWHCDRAGNYSMYSAAITNEDYLRGVQATDSNGMVTFTTIFPACYSGRWPHIHFEIYPTLNSATVSSNKLRTSQLAMPATACHTVFATTGYEASISNFAKTSLTTDNVFSDGSTLQVASVTGNVSDGYVATLVVGVAV
jgi:protocatechuate 3,4-dioxygenase beta subunit